MRYETRPSSQASSKPAGEALRPTTSQTSTPRQDMAVPVPKLQTFYNAEIRLDVTSPVTQSGCYEFDRVIKSGKVLKRTRKTKSWRSVYLVLRPNHLSIYKDSDCTKLRNQLTLPDLTAVARQRDPKREGHFVFGIFSPSRNYHIETEAESEAQEWVEAIRRAARIDLDEDVVTAGAGPNIWHSRTAPAAMPPSRRTTIGSSSDEQDIGDSGFTFRPSSAVRETRGLRRPSHTLANFSGNDGSISDFSDLGALNASTTSFSNQRDAGQKPLVQRGMFGAEAEAVKAANGSSEANIGSADERVIYQGWLYLLKKHHGVRQWRSVWAVLRSRSFAIYKDEQEYAATLVVPVTNVLDAVDCDAISKTKTACLQLITEEKNYRFCAMSEEELALWLGAFKALLAKKKDGDRRRSISGHEPAVAAAADAPALRR